MYMKWIKNWGKVQTVLQAQLENERGQFAVDLIIGIVVSIVLAAVIVMPNMETLIQDMMDAMTAWWNSIQTEIFPPA